MKLRLEIWIFALVILLANVTLFTGTVCEPFVFMKEKVASGEWWRIATFPFVHVGWYHLLMDAGAFLFLYQGLQECSTPKRLLYVFACATGSLLFSLLLSPMDNGLCGLSGIAHGLMAITGFELARSKEASMQMAGRFTLFLVIGKSLVEAATGIVLFRNLHVGNVGIPVAACHLGGVLGGALMFLAERNTTARIKTLPQRDSTALTRF